MKIVNLIAPFPREECLRRLRPAVGEDTVSQLWVGIGRWLLTPGSAVIGEVGDRTIRLRKALSIDSSTYNPFQTHLFGTLTDDGHQTRLQCRVGVHPFTIAVMILYCCVVPFICLIIGGAGSATTITIFGKDIVEAWLAAL